MNKYLYELPKAVKTSHFTTTTAIQCKVYTGQDSGTPIIIADLANVINIR